jgi:hypothetical protein
MPFRKLRSCCTICDLCLECLNCSCSTWCKRSSSVARSANYAGTPLCCAILTHDFHRDASNVLFITFVYLVEITNKMQPCIIIYYSNVHWRLNMFRAVYRSSSGALIVFAASGLHTHVVTGRSQVWVGIVPTQTWLRPVTTWVCKPEAANTIRAPDDERYTARNMLSLQWTVE